MQALHQHECLPKGLLYHEHASHARRGPLQVVPMQGNLNVLPPFSGSLHILIISSPLLIKSPAASSFKLQSLQGFSALETLALSGDSTLNDAIANLFCTAPCGTRPSSICTLGILIQFYLILQAACCCGQHQGKLLSWLEPWDHTYIGMPSLTCG